MSSSLLIIAKPALAAAGDVTLVSYAAGKESTTGNAGSGASTVSADGRYVAFVSAATDLVPGVFDANGTDDVFLLDRATGRTRLVSAAAPDRVGLQPRTGDGRSGLDVTISADGALVAFTSRATDLMPDGSVDLNDASDVFVYDVATDQVALVSHATTSVTTAANGSSGGSRLSSDGRLIAFTSEATNLVHGQVDANAIADAFLFRWSDQTVTLVSHSTDSPTTTGDRGGAAHGISGDGRFVLFTSSSADLVSGWSDPNPWRTVQVFLFERATGLVTLVSHANGSSTTPANMNSGQLTGPPGLAVSADGSFVAFSSWASNLLPQPPPQGPPTGVYLFERTTGAVTHVGWTRDPNGHALSMSDDGRFVAYTADQVSLPGGGPPRLFGVQLFDRASGTTTLVSGRTHGASWHPHVSADGAYVAFDSYANDLVAGQTDDHDTQDVFLFDRATASVTLISHVAGSPTTAAGSSTLPPERGFGSISADGGVVTFSSSAANLVPEQADTNNSSDVFVFESGASPDPPDPSPACVPGIERTQCTKVRVTSAPGVLSIAVAQAAVPFAEVAPGSTSAAVAVGDITYKNTLGRGNSWTATIAATSLVDAGGVIPFSGMAFSPGPTISPDDGATGTLDPGNPGSFSGSDPTPGTSFSEPLTLMTGPGSSQGSFRHTGSTVSLSVPAGSRAGSYAGTLQYTVTG